MADDGAVAVAEAPVTDVSTPESTETESTESTPQVDKPEQDELDRRRQPDSLRKRIADLRRQADAAVDPKEKEAILKDAKRLTDGIGKLGGYEQVWPTVKEAREWKTLSESVGGREGFIEMQSKYNHAQEIDQALHAGNPIAVQALWEEAPEGMVKLAPQIFAQLEKANPEAYEKEVTSHAIRYFEKGGFTNAIRDLYQGLEKGDGKAILGTVQRMEGWFNARKGQVAQTTQVDPRVQQLETELNERKSTEYKEAVDRAYSGVVDHAGPIIDRYLKPIVSKLGLSKEQYNALRQDAWKTLQDERNNDGTFQTVSAAKQRQGMDAVAAYLKQETERRAEAAAKSRAQFWYGHQLRNGAVKAPNPTATPLTPGVIRGKEPSPAEIDYSIKGIQAAKKAGYKDLSDMILAGKAPLKAGGIRQWR